MIPKVSHKLILSFLLLTSLFALLSAYISQYIFGLQPCILCIYQRIPFFVVIFLTIFAIFIIKDIKWRKLIIKLSLATLLFNTFLAIYHVGVEQGFFIFDKCADTITNTSNLEELKRQIMATKAVRCDEPQFYLFGITMAGYNIIYCLGIIILSILTYRKIK
jgi:disulfide bond formation protein DsbB